MKIRAFRNDDYKDVCRWWVAAGEPIPPRELIPALTYILETEDGVPWVCLSLITFNTLFISWSCGLVSNPEVPKKGRKEAVRQLWDHVAMIAKSAGYKNLLCIAPSEKLEKRYQELGFVPTKRNQTFMVRELGG